MKYFFTIFLFIIITFNFAFSQNNQSRILPKFLGASNVGKEFWLTFLPCWDEPEYPGYMRIYVTSQYKTKVKLEILGLGVVRIKEAIPNQVLEFELPTNEGQVYTKGSGIYPIPPHREEIWPGRAIKITAEDPIICYGMTQFPNNSEGFLALPINNWGKNYQVASYADYSDNKTQFLPSQTAIVAGYDKTEVMFKLGGNPKTGVPLENFDTLKFGQTVKRTLNMGDVWLIPGLGENNDLTGSQITSNKDIAVFSGNFSTKVPINIGTNNFLCEQEIPTDYWGKNYYIPTIVNRKYSSIVKIFAKEENTEILSNKFPLCKITELNGLEGTGYFEIRATTDSLPIPILINSNKYINVVLFNTGKNEDSTSINPFQMNIVSEEQYLNDISINIPGVDTKTKFNSNYINIIFKSKSNSIPEDMLLSRKINDTNLCIKLSDFIEYSNLEAFKNEIPDIEGNLHYSLTFKIPNTGLCRIKAKEPFGIYSYGCSDSTAYGYPLSFGMVNQSYTDTVVPEIKINDLKNGNFKGTITERGNSLEKTTKNKDDFQNENDISGYSLIEMINDLSYNYKFKRDDFVPGDTKLLNFRLSVIDSTKESKAVIYISDKRGNDTTLNFENKIPIISQIPTLIYDLNDFGFIKSGQKKQISFKLKNLGKVESIPIYSLILEFDNNGFKVLSDLEFPLKLKSNEEKSFIVEFSADTKTGEFINNIGLNTLDSTYFLLMLKSTVVKPSINVSDVDFGDYKIGSDILQNNIIISNQSHTILEINKIDYPKNSVFKILMEQPTNENPLKIPAFNSIKIPIEFNSNNPGEFNESVVFYSDAKVTKNVSHLYGRAIINSVQDFENKYGVINLIINKNEIAFNSNNEIILNSYKIYDLKGKIILSGSPVTILNNFNIKLPNLIASVYFIELNTKYGKIVKKFILE